MLLFVDSLLFFVKLVALLDACEVTEVYESFGDVSKGKHCL